MIHPILGRALSGPGDSNPARETQGGGQVDQI
jgi:hypothetical protein